MIIYLDTGEMLKIKNSLEVMLYLASTNNKLHRLDGPALINNTNYLHEYNTIREEHFKDRNVEFWINGERFYTLESYKKYSFKEKLKFL